jgi:2-keto-3-deoxy-L-rhamnonate aldolase RhmA
MNPFFDLIARREGDPTLGTFLMSASPIVAEAVGHAGYDWGIVDMEHGPIDMMGLVHLLQAVSSTPMLPVVRVPWNDAVTVKRVLDAGATTLLFPFVQNADEARAAVAATRYPPLGVRGMAGISRGSLFGTAKDHFVSANDRIGVILQLETRQGIDRLEEIAAVSGVDALFLGPADLSGSLGMPGQLTHPDVVALVADAAQRCRAAGKPVGTLVGAAEVLDRFPSSHFDFIAVASDLAFLMRRAQAELQALKARCAMAPAASVPAPGSSAAY